MFRRVCILAALLLVTAVSAALAEGSSTVKSYKELLQAVNVYGCTDITVNSSYRHGTEGIGQSLCPSGTVTIHPEDPTGELTLTGRFDVSGGTVIFDRINLQGSAAMSALWVGGNAAVTVLDVQGGESAKAIGGCGVEACGNAVVTVRKAVGGYGKSLGGDGVYACGGASVTAESAAGGSSSGYGGAGAVCWQAKVTVTGSAAGGTGSKAGGPALLQGLDGTACALGQTTDAAGWGKAAPKQPASYAELLYALRTGSTQITLASSFKYGTATRLDKALFVPSGDPITIQCSASKKSSLFNSRLCLCGGTFTFSGLSVKPPTGEAALCVTGNTSVSFTGKLTARGTGLSVLAAGSSAVTVSGDAVGVAVVSDTASITLTGSLKRAAKATGCLLLSGSSRAVITGDLTGCTCVSDQASLELTGSMTAPAGANALLASGACTVRVSGNLTSKAKAYPALAAEGTASVSVGGSVSGSKKTNAIVAHDQCSVTVAGSVSGGTSGTVPVIWQEGSLVTVSGTVSGSVYTKPAETTVLTLN